MGVTIARSVPLRRFAAVGQDADADADSRCRFTQRDQGIPGDPNTKSKMKIFPRSAGSKGVRVYHPSPLGEGGGGLMGIVLKKKLGTDMSKQYCNRLNTVC